MTSTTSNVLEDIYSKCSEALSSIYNIYTKDDSFEELPHFGPAQWREYAGLEVTITEPPQSLLEVADNPSPFFPGHTIRQTHILCCIPKDLSVEELYKVFNKDISRLDEAYKEKNPETYWCWVAKKVALVSWPDLNVQEQELEAVGHKAPFLLEVAVAIYAARNLKKDLILFRDQNQATNCRKGRTAPNSITILGGDGSNQFVCGYASGWRSPGVASVIRQSSG